MTYDQLIGVLIDAPRDAWLHNDQKGVYTFKYDLDVTLRENRPDDDQLFQEPWATRFPDRNARRVTFELWYRASFVKEYYFVSVDGGRALLPYPKAHDDLRISREAYAIGRTVDNPRGGLDEYLRRAQIIVDPVLPGPR